MNKKQALEALKYNEEYIEEIHHINSNALVAIIEKDVAKLKELKEEIEYLCENWRYYPDSPNKLEYYKAIKYFIKELVEYSQRDTKKLVNHKTKKITHTKRRFNMQWSELCEKAKEMGCATYVIFEKQEVLRHNTTGFLFCKDGDCYIGGSLIHNRKYEQMLMIMEALR